VGALTSKITEYTYRPWEPRTIIEIDDSEVSHFNIRTERLKTNRVRFLPIQYWISDKKRFSKDLSVSINPSINFTLHRFFVLQNILKESKNVNYMISNISGYFHILNKIFDVQIKNISSFFAKRLKTTTLSKLNVFDDLLLNHKKKGKTLLPSFDKLNLTNEIILLTNTRLESPALNAFLFKNSDKYTFVSFSAFASNIKKHEIPLSNYTLTAAIKGFFSLLNKTIISSCLNTLPLLNIENNLVLTPRYLNRSEVDFEHQLKPTLNFLFSLRTKKIFQPIFLTNNTHQSYANLILGQNTFDQFVLKQIDHKFISRLLILANIIKPSQQYNYSPIKLLQNTSKNDQSVLFQTIKTI
jgi:hypothetical protein